MTKGYLYVKNWRLRTKDRIIAAMGGKCSLCSYNTCSSALALHHLDPSQKDFNFGNQSATTPKNWHRLVVELRKCILLCHNCHCEVHAGLKLIPTNVARFDETFSTYTPLIMKQSDLCPICNKLKSVSLKVCSRECRSKTIKKVDWSAIDLAEEIKSKSILALSKELGCSDVAIHKRLKKLGLK